MVEELDQRPVIIGMNNPLHVDPKYALYPAPEGCTGWRIWQMLKSRVPEVSRNDYVTAFDRHNLVRGKYWSGRQASEAAAALRPALRHRVVLLLGNGPRDAFGLIPMLIHPQKIDGVTWRQLPHPSGRNRWYNSPENRAVASMVLESLYMTWKGEGNDYQSGQERVRGAACNAAADAAGGS